MSENAPNEWVELLKIFVIAFLVMLIIRLFLFSPVVVDGPSMQPTLEDRDRMIVNKIKYKFMQPDRFDIVIFHASHERDFIKRIVGLPGEHIAVEDNVLYVNGEEVKQPFLEEIDEKENTYPIITSDFRLESIQGNHEIIPEGYVLVLGDNRTNSTDSRHMGLISMDEIVGNTNLIYWPFKRMQFIKK